MATYGSIVSAKRVFATLLHFVGAALPPERLEIYKLAHNELKSFQDFVERLDGKSRKRMSASLERVTVKLLKYESKQFVDEILSLIEELKKVKEEYNVYAMPEEEEDDEEEVIASSSSLKMVGLRDERSELKEAIMDTSVTLTFFLLYGMAGIGKTTLARELFHDLDISEWFECRAWVTVGLERKSEELAGVILAELDPDAHKMIKEGDEEGADQLLESFLKKKRCLIVLDDVWDNYDFDRYWCRFPPVLKEKNGRVIVTSRFNHSDNYCTMDWAWYNFEKRLLNKQESWDLLREKAFVGGSCPPHLEEIGKKIADKCEGLPLTIVIVADLLSKADESIWINVAEKKNHQVFIDAYDQISKVLYPSYKELIDEIKPCFLYMGVFPLKYKIPRSKLVKLWTVEEIFDPTVRKSEIYSHDIEILKYLDYSCLVMVYKRGGTYFHKTSIQAISKIGLHSSWWHFCLREARKTNFFHILGCPEDGLEEKIKGQSRLSIHYNVLFALKDVHSSIEKNCATTAKTLLCFGPYHSYQVPICFGLKLLQRLDALNIRFYEFPLEVLELVELRYLALTCNGKLPPSISKLGRLQYLTVHPHLSIKSHGDSSYMPMEIWDLEELKHLQVMGSDLPDSGENSLGMLSTLSHVSTRSCKVLNRLPNLKNLKFTIELTPDAADPLCFSNHISNLISDLESLKCIVVNPGCVFQVVPPVASFPTLPFSLKELSLSGLGYPWKEMSKIASLPSLKKLKLRYNAFRGQIWGVEEWEFPSLDFLLIEDIDLVKLKGAPDSFKCLKHISIKHCYELEEVHLGNFPDFKIELVDSNPLAEKCIKQVMLECSIYIDIDISVHYSWKSAKATPIRRNAFRRW